jgi:hypothetical protein
VEDVRELVGDEQVGRVVGVEQVTLDRRVRNAMILFVGTGVAEPLNRSPWSTMTSRILPRGVVPYARASAQCAASARAAARRA